MARLAALSTYSMMLMRRFEASGDRAELDHAIHVARQVLAECAETDPDRGAYLSNLAVLLRMRYQAVGDHDALLEAVTTLTEALRLMAPADRDRGALHANLAMTLRLSYERTGAVATLDAATDQARAGLAACDDRHPQRAAIQATLAALLRALAERTHDPDVCEEGLGHARSAVALDPGHRPALLTAAALCRMRYEHTDAEADLDDAVAFARAAADGADPLDTSYLALHSGYSTALFARYERFGNPTDLDDAITAARAAAAARAPGQHDLGSAATNLAGMLRTRFDARGDLDDLTEAVAQGRAAVAAPAGPAARVAALTNLASGLQALFERTDEPGCLDEAIELRRVALDAATEPGQLTAVQSGLATALRARHERSGTLTDLDDAISAGAAAVRAARHDPRAQARHLANLSAAYRTRLERVGDPDDLDHALETARKAIDQTPDDDQHLPRRRSILALALLRKFTQDGDLPSVDEAIALGRAAVSGTAPGNRLRPRLLGNVANALRARYERTRDLADLHEAVAIARQAVAGEDESDALRPRRPANLSATLLRRFEATRQRGDIDAAVDAASAAVRGTPDDHPARPLYLINLGLMLFRRYEAFASPADLETSILASATAINATPHDHPDRPGYLSNLVAPLLAVGALTGDEGHLDQAVRVAREAATAPGSADPGGVQFNLGTALESRHLGRGAEEDRLAAVEAFAACAANQTTTPLVRAVAATRQARLAALAADWRSADAAYAAAIALLPLIGDRTGGWDSRQYQLAQLSGLGSNAAGVALQLGDADRAVLILEQTRGILISQALDSRADVRLLGETHPDLAAAFERLRAILNADTQPSSEADTDLHAMADPAAWRRRAAAEFRDLVDTVRRIPRHRAFLRPPDIAEVRGFAVAGPIVIVNASPYRCDALLIRTDGIVVVPLPDLEYDQIVGRASEMVAATAANTWTTNDTVVDVLGWLWDTVAVPVVAALALPPAEDGLLPRLQWLLTGALSLLPLHAAGQYTPAGPRHSMLDLAVSSYLVTLRGIDPTWKVAVDPPGGGPLVVGMASTPGQPLLPQAHAEARLASGHLDDRAGPLLDATATRSAVAERLDGAGWAHFACHARTDIDDPAASALLLADGPLYVRDIIAGPSTKRKLAFLSACTTAVTSTRFLDEAVHIVSAFHLAGFRHVIGSLWLVDDNVSYNVAQTVYAELAKETDSAMALHRAVSTLSTQYPASPSLWAAYIHSGPLPPRP